MSRESSSRHAHALASLGALFDASVTGTSIPPEVRTRAYARALAVIDAGPAEAGGPAAVLGFAADMFLAAAVELAADLPLQRELVTEIARAGALSPLALGREVLSAPRLLQLPAPVAIEVTLTMLLAFAGVPRAAIFRRQPGGELSLLAQAGDLTGDTATLRTFARELLSRSPVASELRMELAGTALEPKGFDPFALVIRGPEASAVRATLLLESAAPLLAAALERSALQDRGAPSAGADLAAAERRLARLRYDLHDGPQQDVIMLADDMRLFASQFASVYGGSDHAEIVLGRLDDLLARLVTIDGDLRRIATFVQSPFLTPEPLPEALHKLVDKFVERTGVEPTVELDGDFTSLSDSQQITLLGLIREALSNIREHAEASDVSISVRSADTGVSATVVDDGRGFDPETMLVRAARTGHLGLVGMYERVRMLGGVTNIDSRPGGPTVISVTLPPGPEQVPTSDSVVGHITGAALRSHRRRR